MPIGSLIAVYFVVWWICLFIVLPFNVRNQVDVGEIVPGTEPGAPAMLRFWPKLVANSIISAVLTVLILWGWSNPWLQHYWNG
ncbi:bsl4900; hypothetical protein [Devosia sp. DBB001]|nr:bsl4900; hypothetical protein [Devosia sp. DBB001]